MSFVLGLAYMSTERVQCHLKEAKQSKEKFCFVEETEAHWFDVVLLDKGGIFVSNKINLPRSPLQANLQVRNRIDHWSRPIELVKSKTQNLLLTVSSFHKDYLYWHDLCILMRCILSTWMASVLSADCQLYCRSQHFWHTSVIGPCWKVAPGKMTYLRFLT